MNYRPRTMTCWTVLTAALLGAPAVLAQGGLRWPGVSPAPIAYVIQVDDRHVDVYIPGWITQESPSSVNADGVGVGLGLESGPVRTIDRSEFEDEDSGAAMESGTPLFPFGPDLTTGASFDAQVNRPSLLWTGFSATASRKVPGFSSGTLRFRVSNPTPIVLPDLVKNQLEGAVVGVAQVDASGRILVNSRLSTFMLRSPRILPAAPLYYKFDRGVGDFAVNHVLEYQGGPRTGSVPGNAWEPIGFGGGGAALSGSRNAGVCSCPSEWRGGAYARFTIAWHMRLPANTTAGSQESYVFRGPGNVQMFSGGAAGTDIWCAGLQGLSGLVTLQGPDVRTPAAKDWVHVALRVDHDDLSGKTSTQWFLDGVAQGTPQTRRDVLAIPEDPLGLEIGGTLGKPNFYDLDEFRVTSEVASAAQIRIWSRVPDAVAAAYRVGSGCVLQYTGIPKRGNAGDFNVVGPSGSPFVMVVGLPVATPFPLALGTWFIDLRPGYQVLIKAITDPVDGKWRLPLKIPSGVPAQSLQCQVYMAPPGKPAALSRPLTVSIE